MRTSAVVPVSLVSVALRMSLREDSKLSARTRQLPSGKAF